METLGSVAANEIGHQTRVEEVSQKLVLSSKLMLGGFDGEYGRRLNEHMCACVLRIISSDEII